MTTIRRLAELGQSCWLDTLGRELIESGELSRRVAQQGISGVTSSPRGLHTALTSPNDSYRLLINSSRASDAKQLYEELVTTDAMEACDILRPVYDRTRGADGYVGLEVSPHVAHDAARSLVEARRLFRAVNRDNLMIEIPATKAGLGVMEQLIVDGIPVNATLLFSVRRYAEVAESYLRALERRQAQGDRLDSVASVATFLPGRLDALADTLLSHRTEPRARELEGKLGIATAKLAYQVFSELTKTDRWKQLERAGAPEQRLLWASTSQQNPEYSDLKYIEPLVGKHTINTMRLDGIEEFGKHGEGASNAIERGVDEASALLVELEDLGIDVEQVATQLENEGIQRFIEAYDASLQHLAAEIQKRERQRAPHQAAPQL